MALTKLEEQKRHLQHLETLEKNYRKDGPSRKTRDYIEKKIQALDQTFESFKLNHQALQQELPDGDTYFKQRFFEQGKEKYQSFRSQLEKDFAVASSKSESGDPRSLNHGQEQISGPSHLNFLPNTRGTTNEAEDTLISTTPMGLPKLPPIQIPIFSGGSNNWKQFVGLFNAVIDSNPYLGDIQKLQYLLTYLKGEAEEAVAHLQLCAHNYRTALVVLEERFANDRQAASDYVDAMLDAKKLEFRSPNDVISLYNTLRNCLAGLHNMGYETSQWSPIINRIVMRKFDNETLRLFEEKMENNKEFPSLESLYSFLLKRYQLLSSLKPQPIGKTPQQSHIKKKSFVIATKHSCPRCKSNHRLFACDEFKQLTPSKRVEFVNERKICGNCLSHSNSTACKSKIRCFECNKGHHTLLHVTNAYNANIATKCKSTVILATALVRAKNIVGKDITLRALIDPGSQSSFISLNAAKQLGLPKRKILASITGIGGVEAATVSKAMTVQIASIWNSTFRTSIETYVLKTLTTVLPDDSCKVSKPSWITSLQLADPDFNKASGIDLVLGADVFEEIIEPGIKRGNPLLAQKTKLGWIISGTYPLKNTSPKRIVASVSTTQFEQSMKKFFEMDVVESTDSTLNEPEIIYQTTTARDNTGRYIVSLPFKDEASIPPLGESRNRAMIQFRQLEKRLNKNEELKRAYNDVLREYINLGHMSPVGPYVGDERNVYYLPHHAVIKAESTTTKVRVVFNASQKTTSGSSLNDHLHVGSKIQDDLATILLRWRKYPIVYVADIEKMFRMIKVHPNYHDYQRILWRPHSNGPIQEFTVTVVLFGQAPSNFLAVRTLHQLADDERETFPNAAKALKEDCYVDNLMTGAETRSEAAILQKELVGLLRAGGFNLRKWATNDAELLSSIPEELRDDKAYDIIEDATLNTLGIEWNASSDCFGIKPISFEDTGKLTKRTLLSNIATIYDPLQWLAPFTVKAKLLMQRVWQSEIGWDDIPSQDIVDSWNQLKVQLPILGSISIPRWIHYSREHKIEVHGFCDASEAACAAVIYSRTITSAGRFTTSLLCAKTRIAPLKSKITLPRQELNGALLLAELMDKTVNAMQLGDTKIHCWSDSTIVLSWLQKEPAKLESYVGNRVSKINKLSKASWSWSHVISKENPADCASRGISAHELKEHKLWWKGPYWLQQQELPTGIISFMGVTKQVDLVEQFSNFRKLVKITAYCRRFVTKIKGQITSEEYEQARLQILRVIQQKELSEEIDEVMKNRPLKKRLRNLQPFIDEQGLLRVGGRLRNANIAHDHKHPILLPKNHHVTHLIIREAHEATMHGTVDMVRNYLRMRYWITNDKQSIRSELHRCLTCFRFMNRPKKQMMGDQPAVRLTPTHPFLHCGVDFAGPFKIRTSRGRAASTLKGYACIFVCMVTKAVHIEVVSDMSTEAFLAAFKRLISRRGVCKEIFSDNGTNFTAANKQIDNEMREAIERSSADIARISARDGITWKFIPVSTPHFGGLWEAAVKSAKHQLKCILNETKIIPTFEELTTVLCQIEACLNSRPLAPLTNNPNDLEALTPGHFLVQRPLLAIPEIDRTQANLHDRWEQLKTLTQTFWKRWTCEYLHHLQGRAKWTQEMPNLKKGQLVLVRRGDTPPTKWPLARIKEVHPGVDGKVRAVTIQYHGNREKQIGIVNLAPLPIDQTEEHSDPPQTKDRKRPVRPHKTSHKDPPTRSCSHASGNGRPKKIKIAPCTWARSLLNLAILLITFGSVFTQNISTPHYQIWKPSIGYHIEKLGHSKIIRGTLRMEFGFPIHSLMEDKRHISSTLNHTYRMCKMTEELVQTTHCDSLLKHLSSRHDDITRQIQELLEMTTPAHRNKRGLLGSMLTSVFGVNDQVYRDLETLQHNQQSTLQAMTQQNMLFNTRLDVATSSTSKKLDEFTTRFNKLVESVNQMNKWYTRVDHGILGVQVISTYLTAVEYYHELEVKYAGLTAILYGHGTILRFITYRTIDEAITKACLKIGPYYTILRKPQKETNIIRDKENLVLYGYFLIVENNEYEVLHVTAIPRKIGRGKFLMPHVPSPTFAVNYHQETYFDLGEHELDACKIDNDMHLCSPKLIKNINKIPNCIIDEVYERPNKPKCPRQELSSNATSLKQMMAPNTWLFAANDPVTASIICSGQRFEVSLNDVGIIHTVENSLITVDGTNLRSTISEMRKVTGAFTKEIDPVQWNATYVRLHDQTIPIAKISQQILDQYPTNNPTWPVLHQIHERQGLTLTLAVVLTCVILAAILFALYAAVSSACIRRFFPKGSSDDISAETDIPLSERLAQLIGRPPAC